MFGCARPRRRRASAAPNVMQEQVGEETGPEIEAAREELGNFKAAEAAA